MVVKKIEALLAAGSNPQHIGIITALFAQVRLLREKLPEPALEIDTVDASRTRKRSDRHFVVRSNEENDIGFLADLRRTNVAMTARGASC